MSRYRTIRRDAVAEIEVKRSRFRCVVERVATEDDARAVVERLRAEYRDARHHCSALVLGPGSPDGEVERAHDDGEPSGTAGAPMLEVLRGAEVADVVAVVTRWFGGTLLGAGGLVRAYSDAVRVAVEQAGTRERALLHELDLTVGHAEAGRIESDLRARGMVVLDTGYGADVSLLLGVEPDQEQTLHAALAELTGGRMEATRVGERWVDVG
ncbi:YigZ family protein [Nocardioides sp.]|uniref:IMPACT family protein n=1 Tax=Nocardioides sp. TaxID=35761 RepID=UPI002B27B404|nr:YigZ family protein [Nocardioides sp.]